MKMPVFQGTCTALITPFTEDGVNYSALEQLLEQQIAAGVDAVVLCGTTGEASAMTAEEQIGVIRHGAQYIDGRMTVIAGTGSNCTAHAVALSEAAEKAGADAVLIVTPYYNKATERGLILHYTAIADAISIPVIAYNVPSRTGVNMSLHVYEELSCHPNINGVKEASGDIAKIARTIGRLDGRFYVWSGNDDQNVPILSLGGQGVISVLSNVSPDGVCAMVKAALGGDYAQAARLQRDYMPLIDALFSEVNPIPVKTAMNLLGFDAGLPRLPLCGMEPEHVQQLKTVLGLL
ncbi:MAG: 4-hydroxy-tetrahydrodipicolinate synthase [Oscillospiraceae bacterium]|nr:4-hydroxy-tetrahydrodipicolinate synthase [Oscillospiraceae bacterium]